MTNSTRDKWTNDESTKVPYRIWFSIKEAAQLSGMSEDFLRDEIRKSRKAVPTPDGIRCRQFGTQWRIHRSYLYPDEIQTIASYGLTAEQIKEAVRELFREAFVEAEPRPLRKVG